MFVQIIEFSTTRREEVEALYEDYRRERGDSAPTGRVCRDRERPDYYYTIVEFPSYEEAMANSERPETSEWAARFAKLCDGAPTFRNLDVIRELG